MQGGPSQIRVRGLCSRYIYPATHNGAPCAQLPPAASTGASCNCCSAGSIAVASDAKGAKVPKEARLSENVLTRLERVTIHYFTILSILLFIGLYASVLSSCQKIIPKYVEICWICWNYVEMLASHVATHLLGLFYHLFTWHFWFSCDFYRRTGPFEVIQFALRPVKWQEIASCIQFTWG